MPPKKGQEPSKKRKISLNKELFIEEVKKYPYLFDLTDKRYKDIGMKEDRWASIGALFKISKVEAYKSWRAVRDRYRKEKRAIDLKKKSGAGADDDINSKWEFFLILDGFLKTTLEPRETSTNIDEPFPQSSSNSSSFLNDTQDEDEDDEVQDNMATILFNSMDKGITEDYDSDECALSIFKTSPTPEANAAKIVEPPKKKQKKENLDNKFEKMIELSEKTLVSQLAATQKPERDEIFHYFSSLMGRYRKFSKKNQVEARHKIENIYYEIEKTDSD